MLNLEKFNINKEDTIIAAVSGGPDSMFLISSLVLEGYKPIVCHVNYHKRDSALRDEKIVEKYCDEKNLIFYKKDCRNYIGNFQDYAREFRYNFFKEIYQKHQAKCLLVAHQLDDCLETYIYKKNRNSKGSSLSILCEDYIFDMRVIRPLLDLTKDDILNECKKNNIPYGIDESNLTTHYSRNKIRNEYIASLSKEEKNKLINEMKETEKQWQNTRESCLSILHNNSFNLNDFNKLNAQEKNIVLCELIKSLAHQKAKKLSSGYLQELIDIISKDRSHCYVEIESNLYLEKNKDTVSLHISNIENFEYILIDKEDKNCPFLKDDGVKMEGICVFDEDYPLTIRNYQENDKIELKSGHKSVARLFIDKKIPLLERKTYPILLNKNKEILLIPLLYRKQDRKDLNNNLFMLK